MKGLSGWFEIFRVPKSGKVVDSQGREHDGKRFLQKAVELFNPEFHEPPMVVGHPKDNAPAMGWVAGVKAVGDSLFALPKDVIVEFAEAVKQGLYKKRSASFYPDGSLRHVGFLGAMPPAIKGLTNIEFNDGDKEAVVFEFSEADFGEAERWSLRSVGRVLRRMREYFIEKEGVDRADRLIPEYEIEGLTTLPPQVEAVNPSFTEPGTPAKGEEGSKMKTYTEEELNQKLREEREKAAAEFADTQAKEKARADIHAGNVAFIQGLPPEKITPAMKHGMVEFMDALGVGTDGATVTFEFSEGEGGEKKSATPLDYFKEFVANLPKAIDFSEVASKESDPGGVSTAKKEEDAGRDIAKRARR